MAPHQLTLLLLDGTFAVCKLAQAAPVPHWAVAGDFLSITRTADELSIVCSEAIVPPGIDCERGWRCLRVAGTIPCTLVGILASMTVPLAEARVGVFAISTFDTDYLLVKETDLGTASDALKRAGHAVN